jgi:hypothetical protein
MPSGISTEIILLVYISGDAFGSDSVVLYIFISYICSLQRDSISICGWVTNTDAPLNQTKQKKKFDFDIYQALYVMDR